MTSEHDIRLPEGPAASANKREAAIEQALASFDRKFAAHSQGVQPGLRLMRQTAHPAPSRRRTDMRVRQLIAASLVVLVAGSTTWLFVHDRLGLSESQLTAVQPSPPQAPVTDQGERVAPRETPAVAPQSVLQELKQAGDAIAPTPVAPVAPPSAQAPADAKPAEPQPRQQATEVVAPAPVAPSAPPTAQAPGAVKKDAAEPGQQSVDVARPAPRPAAPLADARRERSVAAPAMGYMGGPPSQGQGVVRVAPPPPDRILPAPEHVGRDQFAGAGENPFKVVREAPVSTFSIDVDTASYSFVRASLNRNVLPSPAAVRTEELVNYFPYAYEAPASASEPFRVAASVFPSPWSEGRKIVRIGIKGYQLPSTARPRANLVLLIDTSGSMSSPNRLPLVKQALAMLLTQLEPADRVAIVTYAGNAGTALEPTPASEKTKIAGAIERLHAGGSTAGAEGIRQAYALAEQNFVAGGVNRVILATDGDFNVGITSRDELKGFVERQRQKGIFLSVLGFGMGNYNDALMQALAQNGNGTAAYIDTINEARKVLVDEATSTLFPIAKDVKIQVEFNPAAVAEYRLVGYETRLLNRDDFNNDKVDAGEVGSGQTVTALYEIVPVGGPVAVDGLRYAPAAATGPGRAASAGEYAFVKIRYKLPRSDTSALISTPVDGASEHARFEDAPVDARFATGVAAFGEILRGGKHTGRFGYDDVLRVASAARGDDPFGYRTEFVQLVRAAKTASALQSQRP
jgi:Ca-activated chloride channel family protein